MKPAHYEYKEEHDGAYGHYERPSDYDHKLPPAYKGSYHQHDYSDPDKRIFVVKGQQRRG